MSTLFSLALGIGSKNQRGEWLEVFYPAPLLQPESNLADIFIAQAQGNGNRVCELDDAGLSALASALKSAGHNDQAQIAEKLCGSERSAVLVLLENDSAPATVPEAYLKLHLISHRLVKPHSLVLEGLFGTLVNVAWTNQGAIDLEELPARQLQARARGEHLSVDCVDKFPKMCDYVVPAGVRIADTARVRLGAYVGSGTTIMHEGFINFNAGTEGPGMIEGRISAGVMVGKGSDLGGGSSTMGTLSGGGNMVISLGESCLLGANSGTGIPLGDRCTVESGLYITAGTKVAVLDDQRQLVREVKARELAGLSDLLFIRNSVSGRVECLTNKSAVALNESLHDN